MSTLVSILRYKSFSSCSSNSHGNKFRWWLFNCTNNQFSKQVFWYSVFNHGKHCTKNIIQRKANTYQLFKRSFKKTTFTWTNSRIFQNMFSYSTLKFSFKILGGCAIIKCFSKLAHCQPSLAEHTRIVGDTSYSDRTSRDAHFDWKMFFQLLQKEIWLLFLAIVSALTVAAINIYIPMLLGDIVNVSSVFYRNSNPEESFLDAIKQPSLCLIYVYLAQSFFTFTYISSLSVFGERISCNLRTALFKSILKQDIAFFDSHKSGEIVSRLTNDVQEFKSSFKLCIAQGLRSTAQAAGSLVTLYLISGKMTCLLMTVVPSVIIAGTLLGSLLRQLSKIAQAQVARASAVADEAIGNIRTVRAFAMESKENELYGREIEKVKAVGGILGIGIGAFQGLSNLFLNGIVLGVLFVGGSLMSSNDISPGSLMAFLVATQTIQKSLAQISLLFGHFVRGMSAGARVFEYINLKPSIPLVGGIILPYNEIRGEVLFKDVTFSYPTRDQKVLCNFNLKLPAGKMVALCGLSGGGKSTIASLLERYYDINSGSISIDGYNLKELDPSWLRGHVIGFINQEPVLFATSVMENIRYGCPNASDDEVLEAAKLANADEFITSFPNGYNTILGERGVTVSGGQKQRIAIARALLKNPSILILDEATSALDAESEKAVQGALDKVVKGRTVLVIAHRLSTIQNADIITVIANGVVVEMGSHSSLYHKKGAYWQLINQQEIMDKAGESEKRA